MTDDRIMDLLMEMHESLGALHSKLDGHIKALDEHEQADDREHARIAELEAVKNRMTGAWPIILIAVSVVSSLVTLLGAAWAKQ